MSVWEKPPELSFVDLVPPTMDIENTKNTLPELPEELSGLVDPPDHLQDLPAVLPRPTMPPPGLEQQDGVGVSR